MTLRVIDTGLAGADWNVAVTAALSDLHQRGQIGDTLRLHRYHRAVLLGLHSPKSQIDAAACARLGAQIVRRVSGGGAVAMGPGVLAWDLLITRPRAMAPEEVSAGICTAVAAALAPFGATASFRAPGDITTGGQKIGGTAGLFDVTSMLHQGSLLVMPDLDEMAVLLGVDSLPVTTLALAARNTPDMRAVTDAVTAAIADALGLQIATGTLSAAETELARGVTLPEVTA
ncbi:biotin/lipoate A/B protein ligase family protein [Phaeovulum sp.]|uniref:lipoate--protein ligase family protein n=1 Tax=Phaeovulum sp. TaxID=2934796 RepID=UPI0039E2610B